MSPSATGGAVFARRLAMLHTAEQMVRYPDPGQGFEAVTVRRDMGEARVFAIPPALHAHARSEKDPRMPAHWPFARMLLVLTEPVRLGADHAAQLQPHTPFAADIERLGYLVTPDGVWQCDRAPATDRAQGTIVRIFGHRGWSPRARATDDHFAVAGILDAINGVQTTVEQLSRSEIKRCARRAKIRLKLPPPDFYTVTLAHRIAHNGQTGPSATETKATYRTDVRGHYRARVVRGKLPLDPAKRSKLCALGYVPVRPEHRVRQPGPGEWAMVRRVWVRAYVRGPSDAPLVPAVRVVPSGDGIR